MTHSLNFLSSEDVLISSIFLKDIFAEYIVFVVDSPFSHFLLASMVSDEKFNIK